MPQSFFRRYTLPRLGQPTGGATLQRLASRARQPARCGGSWADRGRAAGRYDSPGRRFEQSALWVGYITHVAGAERQGSRLSVMIAHSPTSNSRMVHGLSSNSLTANCFTADFRETSSEAQQPRS